ncbi:hypothetical protein [Virgibacillus sp. MSP4-1]|uniref:hypothetical protein n=1 Tax=Virgibacillus sp. MSP4-1 TaxID=2700081 RepID=UPI0003A7BF99|nr:hypothetical protein [Virgibacillus sp. MSP4-1]
MHHYNQMNPYQTQTQGSFQPDHMKNQCQTYMNYHVIVQLNDGSQFDGIIDDIDAENVVILVAEDIDADITNRQFGYDYDDNYGFGGYGGYGRPRRRSYRRFRRQRFPFRFIGRLFPYPYFYPFSPYGYGGGY